MKKMFVVMVGLLLVSFNATAANQGTLWVFSGKGAANQGDVSKRYSKVYQIEQEWDIGELRSRVGYLNEGTQPCGNFDEGHSCKRDGLYYMAVAPHRFNPRLETAFSFGPYLYNETDELNSQYKIKYGVSLQLALSMTYKVSERMATQVRFQHDEFSTDGRATDEFFIGFGYTPESW